MKSNPLTMLARCGAVAALALAGVAGTALAHHQFQFAKSTGKRSLPMPPQCLTCAPW